MEKRAMTSQTLFMILMVAIMIGIIVFGYSRFTMVTETLSDAEEIEIQNKITDVMEYCEDPINSGTITSKRIQNSNFNGICIFEEDDINDIPSDISDQLSQAGVLDDTAAIIENTQDNIILYNVEYFDADNNPQELSIYDSLSTYAKRDQCWFSEDPQDLIINMTC